MSKIHISKLDAALRQLTCSIKLFINEGDPVSIHTLASAAQEILETLAKEESIQSQRIKNISMVKKSRQKEFIQIINRPKNFFKHADRDKKELLEFNTEYNDLIIWDAVNIYMQFTGERTSVFNAVNFWIQFKYPDMFVVTEQQKNDWEGLFKNLSVGNKQAFFKEIIALGEESFKKNMV